MHAQVGETIAQCCRNRGLEFRSIIQEVLAGDSSILPEARFTFLELFDHYCDRTYMHADTYHNVGRYNYAHYRTSP